ncbi:hypothetical protein KKH46_02735 [Patescibacteria group bacterium]|nr:hypothetical protein [Patescibacteria group bacterium]MBU1730635.1 hypothetical protein [Patescibacteria group bacterium]MBU1956368.1 hypothetical protein [Patescibacteria group bacterium]
MTNNEQVKRIVKKIPKHAKNTTPDKITTKPRKITPDKIKVKPKKVILNKVNVKPKKVAPKKNLIKKPALSLKIKKTINSKILKYICSSGVLVVLVTGVVFGYFKYFYTPTVHQLLLETFAEKPEVSSILNLSNFDTNITLMVDNNFEDFIVGDDITLRSQVSYNIAHDFSNTNKPLVNGLIKLDVDMDMKDKDMEVNFGGTMDIKVIDKIAYFRLHDVAPFIFFDVTPYKNKWFKFDLENIIPGASSSFADVLVSGLQQKKEDKEAQKDFIFDPEIIEIINHSGQIESTKNISGKKEYHLIFQVAKEDWATLIQKLYKKNKDLVWFILAEELGYLTQEISKEEVFLEIEKHLSSQDTKVFEALENLSIEMWIDKKTLCLRAINISFDVKNLTIKKDKQKVKLDWDFSGKIEKEYGAPVKVTAPTDAIFFDEVDNRNP